MHLLTKLLIILLTLLLNFNFLSAQNSTDKISTPNIPRWLDNNKKIKKNYQLGQRNTCDKVNYKDISNIVKILQLDGARYDSLRMDQGNRSYWHKQQLSIERFQLVASVMKSILDEALDMVVASPNYNSILDVIPNTGMLAYYIQKWISNQSLVTAYSLDNNPCNCPLKSYWTGNEVYTELFKNGEVLSINEGDIKYALNLTRNRGLVTRDLETDQDLFDAAKDLDLRCNMQSNLHLYYYSGNGTNLINQYKPECRLAQLIAWKSTLLAAERQNVTIHDIGDLTNLATNVLQNDKLIIDFCNCK
ncbi:MAG: hypothetical protein R8P61_22615 [Bacteroidia bacterium]|nr:hypothetical protein [Bacteroidia bacterium]